MSINGEKGPAFIEEDGELGRARQRDRTSGRATVMRLLVAQVGRRLYGICLAVRRVSSVSLLCVADPLHSVFHRHHADPRVTTLPEGCCSHVEGIGRPRVEASFLPGVIDRMVAVDDAASIGAMRALSARLGRGVGGSTGTNFWACATLIQEMAIAGGAVSVVTLLRRVRSTKPHRRRQPTSVCA